MTRRIFGSYVSRYDFKRCEEDQSTVKLVYESRGEKLGIVRLDLNDRIAEAVEKADLDPDQTAQLKALIPSKEGELAASGDPDARERLSTQLDEPRGRAQWMESTLSRRC